MDAFLIPPIQFRATKDRDVKALLAVIILYSISIPTILVYAYKYYQVRKVPCIAARRPNVTVYISLSVITVFLCRIIYCSNAILTEWRVLRLSFIVLYPFGSQLVLWLAVIKYWLLYFDIHFLLHSEGNQWKTHINPNNVTFQTNWYVLHKETMGSESFLLRKVLPFCIALPIILVPFANCLEFMWRYSDFVESFFLLIPIVFIIVIWYKTPKFLDYFRVREECRMVVIISVILLSTLVIFGLISFLLEDYHDFFIIRLCIEFMLLVGILLIALHVTMWTLAKNQHRIDINGKPSKLYLSYRCLHRAMQRNKVEDQTEKIQRKLSHYHTALQSIEDGNEISQNENLLLLVKILENEHGLQMFISHLMSEFCLESALAIIEFTQYQALLRQLNDDIDNGTSNQLSTPSPRMTKQASLSRGKAKDAFSSVDGVKLKLPHIVPQSVIVYDPEQEDGAYDIKAIARKLLEKYVCDGAPFEINISYKLKRKLMAELANIEQLSREELMMLFDEPTHSLLMLLNDSFRRFIKTERYREVEKEIALSLQSVPTQDLVQIQVGGDGAGGADSGIEVDSDYDVDTPDEIAAAGAGDAENKKKKEDYVVMDSPVSNSVNSQQNEDEQNGAYVFTMPDTDEQEQTNMNHNDTALLKGKEEDEQKGDDDDKTQKLEAVPSASPNFEAYESHAL